MISALSGSSGVGLSRVATQAAARLALSGVRATALRAAITSTGSAAVGATAKVANNVANGEPVSSGVGTSAFVNSLLGGLGSVAQDGISAAAQSSEKFQGPVVGAGNALGTTLSNSEPAVNLLMIKDDKKDEKK